MNTSPDVDTLQCNKCNRTFFDQTCFANHLDIRGKKGPSVCNTVFKCLKCNRLFNRKDIAPEGHVCGTTKCGNCKQWVFMSERLCYIEPKPCKGGRCTQEIPCHYIPEERSCYSCRTYTEDYIFFDLERSQNTGEHLINLAIAQDFQGNQYEFTNQKDFCEWLFRKEHTGLHLCSSQSER